LSGENRETIFGTDVYGKYLDAVQVYKKAEKDLINSLNDYDKKLIYGDVDESGMIARGVVKSYNDAVKKGYEGLELMQVKTKDRSDFLEGLGFTDKYTSLKDLYPNIFNADGTINVDMAKAFKSQDTLWNSLSNEQQQYFDSIINNADLMNQALEAQKEYLSSLFGGLGDDISNSMYEAAKAGTDAMGTILF